MADCILVLDAGTTSTRAMVFAGDGTMEAVAQAELTQHYPRPGWVEHDAGEIWDKTLKCAREVVGQARHRPRGRRSEQEGHRHDVEREG